MDAMTREEYLTSVRVARSPEEIRERNKEWQRSWRERNQERARKSYREHIRLTKQRNDGKVCTIQDCKRPLYALGMCSAHYWRKHHQKTRPRTRVALAWKNEHAAWKSMKQRCCNPKNPNFKYYGGRGISVCQRWRDSSKAFYEDMGPRPAGHQIDRIDNDGNYEPGNCRWATPLVNSRNRGGRFAKKK